jgi:hypothetical protein
MGLMILSCVAAVLLVILGLMGSRAGEPAPSKKDKAPITKAEDSTKPSAKASTRANVLKKLEKLSKTDAPKKLSPGCHPLD